MSEEVVVPTEQEASAAISAGYAKVNPPAEVVKTEAEVVETPPEKVETVEADPWEGVPDVVRKTLDGITGKLGSFDGDLKATVGRIQAENTKFEKLLATAQSVAKTVEDAPTQAQIAVAATTAELWQKQKDDYPEWAEGMEAKFAAERADWLKSVPTVDVEGINKSVSTVSTKVDNQRLEQMSEVVAIKYPEWEKTVSSDNPKFVAWYTAQPQEVQALGQSVRARDAIKVLDLYTEHEKAETVRTKNQARLAGVVAPKQANSGGPSILPDEAGLSVGYNRVKRA